MKILADAHIPFLKGVLEDIAEVEYLPGNAFSKETIKDKDALIVRTVTYFGKEILEGSNVKLICSATIGFDHIDTEYCEANGIEWRTCPGCNADSVEQYVTASLLYFAEKFQINLNEKTIGIIGVGNVGSRVAKACEKLGMRVLLNDPPRKEKDNLEEFVELSKIQDEADFITFHLPLTKSGNHPTFHLADKDFFGKLKRRPVFINSARGAVMDTEAVKEALIGGKISGAVIDCWENEPNIDRGLLKMVDISTPHIAGYSADGKWNATRMTVENLTSFYEMNFKPKFSLLPIPDDNVIDLFNVPAEKQLQYAVHHTYNLLLDSSKLKNNPEGFSQFRSNYPLRREYKAYKILNADKSIEKTLQMLGFQI